MHTWFLAVIIILVLVSCTKDRDPMSEPLGRAYIDGRISNIKVSEILQEYARLSSPDSAKRYTRLITAVIDLNGDSTEIDLARWTFFNK
jgi:hypothetical protein